MDHDEGGSQRESGERMPQVKELKELALQVLQPKKKRQI